MPYLPLGSNGFKSDSGNFMSPVAGFQSLLATDPTTDEERRLAQAFEDEGYRWWTLSPRLFRLAALRDEGVEIYSAWQNNLEKSLYTNADDTKNPVGRQPDLDDASGVVINAGVWRMLDFLSIDPNNVGALRLREDNPEADDDYLYAFLGRKMAPLIKYVTGRTRFFKPKSASPKSLNDSKPEQNAYPSISVEPHLVRTCRAAASSCRI